MNERTWVDWGIQVEYWVADGGEDPDIPWPKDWECCGYPTVDPRHLRNDTPARQGHLYLQMPMYNVANLHEELHRLCALIEAISTDERRKWDALEDRRLTFGAGVPETKTAALLDNGFLLPANLLRRLAALKFRIGISLNFGDDPVMIRSR